MQNWRNFYRRYNNRLELAEHFVPSVREGRIEANNFLKIPLKSYQEYLNPINHTGIDLTEVMHGLERRIFEDKGLKGDEDMQNRVKYTLASIYAIKGIADEDSAAGIVKVFLENSTHFKELLNVPTTPAQKGR